MLNKKMEKIDSWSIYGEECPIWTVQANGGHNVFFTNNTDAEFDIKIQFSYDDAYYGSISGNSIFGVMIHGVDFKKNFKIVLYPKGVDCLSRDVIWN